MPKIEGCWDCSYCGSKAIRGGIQVCPNCGKTRSADTNFYMLDTTPVADESAVESGPDWFCPYCDSYNPSSAAVCRSCGHPRDAEDRDYFEMREKQEAAETPSAQSPPPRARRSRGLLFWLLLIAAGILGLSLYLGAPRDRAVTVLNTSWVREVAVDENRLVEESDWTVPDDAVELLDSRREIHHYDQILDHYETVSEQRSREVFDGYDTYYTYEDMGNGFFDQIEHSTPRYRTEYYTETYEEPVYVSVPVYETKYRYTVYRWVYDRTETAEGTTDPYWPAISYADHEREGRRNEEYTVTYADRKGRETTIACDFDTWNRLRIGSSYTIKTQGGRILEIR